MNGADLDFQSICTNIDQLVKSSKFSEVRNALAKLKKIPRRFLGRLAEFAIRSGDALWALRKLHGLVHIDGHVDHEAPRTELIMYAYALYVLGSTTQARQILSHARFKGDAQAMQHLANSFIHEWDYDSATKKIVEIQKTTSTELTAYQIAVAKTNLAACFISSAQTGEAKKTLDELKILCQKNNYSLLLGNIYELYGQLHFLLKDYAKAEADLLTSLSLFQDQNAVYALFARKWLIISKMAQGFDVRGLEREIQRLVGQAEQLELWDIRRDLDFFKGLFFDNKDVLLHAIVGSCKNFVRHRKGYFRTQMSGDDRDFVNFYPQCFKSESLANEVKTDIVLIPSKMTPGTRQMFYALVSDFYAPLKMGRLFELAFSGEVFSPATSPARVLKALKRLDGFFQVHHYPIRVEFNRSNFRLVAKGNCCLRFPRLNSAAEPAEVLKPLRLKFDSNSFTAFEASAILGQSLSTTQRLLKKALRVGLLVSSGNSRATVYSFKVDLNEKNLKVAA